MLNRYRQVLANGTIRTAILVGLFGRIPYFGAGLVVTLHVVQSMGRSYAEAGVATATLVLAMAVAGPWRGRLLDRYGQRRVLLPSIIVQAGYAVVAPMLDFGPFLVAQALAGLFSVPLNSILRQAVIAAAPHQKRRAALSLDAMMLEISAGLAPAICVAAATMWNTSWVLAGVFAANTLAALALFAVNLPLRTASETGIAADLTRPPMRSWFGLAVAALLIGGVVSTTLFSGLDLSVVATLNDADRAVWIGFVMGLWSLGSLIGGLLYGGLQRQLNPFLLLAVLGASSMLPALSPGGVLSLGLLLIIPGLIGQPTLTSTVELIVDRVPESARGEAMGWHSTAMTTGLALGAPITGAAIDRWGGQGGFVLIGLFGIAAGLLLWVLANRLLPFTPPDVGTDH